MKRVCALLLLLALLLSCAACSDASQDNRVNPIAFYYKMSELSYTERSSVVYGLEVDLEDRNIAVSEIVSLYLEGPDEEFLESPFPPGVRLVTYTWVDGLLTLTLSNEFATLTGLDTTMAMACLTLTLTQINGVDAICVLTEDGRFSYNNNAALTPEDFALVDTGATGGATTVSLYYADEQMRYLLLDSRTMMSGQISSEPEYIVQQLIAGSQQENMRSVIPEGTVLRSLELENGVCTVDFSYDFLENKPSTANEERLAIYAIVNSLTELESISAVQITVEGQRLDCYLYMDLSDPITRDESAIGPIREGLNELDATIYIYSQNAELLVGVPMRLRRTASQTVAETTLNALIQAEPSEGFSNPVPSGTKIHTILVEDGLCTVDLSEEFLAVAGNYAAERWAVRAVVATLCGVPGVRRVQLSVDGRTDCLTYLDISAPLVSQFRWSVD